jgi:3-methylcrotonyl-CoA carboxylase beta subunit
VDTSSADFKENARQMKEAIDRVKELQRAAAQGGTQKARDKHIQRGKMLPREYAHPSSIV